MAKAVTVRSKAEIEGVVRVLKAKGFEPQSSEYIRRVDEYIERMMNRSQYVAYFTIEDGWQLGDNDGYVGFRDSVEYKDWKDAKKSGPRFVDVKDEKVKILKRR